MPLKARGLLIMTDHVSIQCVDACSVHDGDSVCDCD